ncbi:MAG: aminotransferase class V-fold PLP-dependent enzyme, partial [Candidatus Eisenbacteria bacterium]|nr:aminotransferase class V-fold PLP-dependent enzyme [Candidatus Eisenbacteria bacterium]
MSLEDAAGTRLEVNATGEDRFAAFPVIGARRRVPLLDGRWVNQIFLDNAASTKPFQAVSDFLQEIQHYYSNIHRGIGFDSAFCTHRYEEARDIIGGFVGWDPSRDVVIPVRNTTEGLNLLANTIPFEQGDRVLISLLEHHSNDLPWRGKARVELIPIDKNGRVDFERLEAQLDPAKGRVRLISITGASNVTGIILPIHDIAQMAHQHGAYMIVDGAQLVPHRRVRMRSHDDPGHIDFLVFSAHKMNSPYGEGAVVGRRDLFAAAIPYLQGGGTVYSVSLDHVVWADPPDRQEAGTPNILGMFAMAKAIQVMEEIGMETVEAHERRLTERLLDGMASIPDIGVLGPKDPAHTEDRLGVVTFMMAGLHHALVAGILSYEWGIAIRQGCFCAHPLIKNLLNISKEQERLFEDEIHRGDRRNTPGAARVSLGVHNISEDVDTFVEALRLIARKEWKG